MKLTKEINKNIFREYDIRGHADDDLSDDVAFTIGKAFGSYLKSYGKIDTVVGYDNRLSSKRIFNALTKGILETGVNITNLGLVTSPMYYSSWTILKKTSGIMITASHNPKEDNGFKFSYNGLYNTHGQMVFDLLNVIEEESYYDGQGSMTNYDIKDEYLEFVTESIDLGKRKIKCIIDCGNGTGSVIAKEVFDKLKIDYQAIYCESDGNFPNHHPDPSVIKNIKDLQTEVLRRGADVGFAFDGDADRIGVIDENGKYIAADELMIIFYRELLPKLDDKRAIFDVKCSKSLEDEIIKLGGTPIFYRTGNSYLRAKIYNDDLKFGGEFSGHIYFNDKFPGYDDALYVALRLVELLSHTDKTVSQLLEGVNKYYSTAELKMEVREEDKNMIMTAIKEYCNNRGYEYLTIDGIKVLFKDGFALIRPSNTGPNLTYRYEASTKERLEEIRNEFDNLLHKKN